MKPENKAILDANRHHYETVSKAGYVKHFNAHEREELLRVMREEFQPNYTTDMWCGPCVFDFVKLLYQSYDKWLSDSQPKEEAITVHATFPKADPPQTSDNEKDTIRTQDIKPNTPNGNNSSRRHFRRRK